MLRARTPAASPPEVATRPATSPNHRQLFILAIIEDEDDAAALRSDLKRSRLETYKIQRCRTLAEGQNLLKACSFDLAFIDLDAHDSVEGVVKSLQTEGHRSPIVGLRSRRFAPPLGHSKPNGIDEVVCKEDLSPSLAEHTVRAILEKHFLAAEKAHFQQRLRLAMDAGKLGAWTYFPAEELFELDPTSAEILKLPPAPALRELDDICRQLFPEDRQSLRDTLESPSSRDGFSAIVRLNSEEMPLQSIEIRGTLSTCGSFGAATFIGTVRAATESHGLRRRIAEANQAIEEALESKERSLRDARDKLLALVGELEIRKPEAPSAALPPPPKSPEPLAEAPPAKPAKSEALAIDSEEAFQQVLKSISVSKKELVEQQAFPFAFTPESLEEAAVPDASKEGFASAAKRLVAMSRKGHGLDVTLSMSDQPALEMESQKELLFDILRELLTNVVKHANATLCIVSIFRDEDEWVLQVEDDGVGLSERPKSVGTALNKFGLFRIRTQLALKGGHLEMAAAMPKGLMARARLPLALSDKATHH